MAPSTGEFTVAVLVAGVFFVLITPLVVQGIAGWATSGNLAWPDGRLLEAYGGLLRGHFGAGLPHRAANELPADAVMWALTLIGEVVVLAAAVVVGMWMREMTGSGSRHGLATAAHAAEALGIVPLRRRADQIRPDLYATRALRREQLVPGRRGRNPRVALKSMAPEHVRPHEVGWRLGRAGRSGPDLWVPFDRTTCVIGPQGSGKTLDLLVPALLDAPGGALVTLTKPEDLFLTREARQQGTGGGLRPVAVLDPFNLAPGTPELVWDPIAGCEESMLAERRAKAFAAGTIKGATAQSSDQAARFYAGECAKVLQAYFHAAAIARIGLEEVLMWVSSPREYPQAEEILRTHPAAEPLWDGLLRGALYGDERTAGNTITTVQQSMALFFQRSIRERCVPSATRPATDIEALIKAGGTIYLLGRDDPYASASPLMTAVTEQILDSAKRLGETSPHGRLCPPFLACLDELPSTAPIPTLSTRMANERALGLSFILAAQTWRQFVVGYGEDEARTIYGLSNNLIVFGGGKDIRFYQELSDLIGSTSHTEMRYSARGHELFGLMDRSWDQRRVPILEPAELRRIEQRKALVLSETYDPIVATLHRCIDGRRGKELLAAQNHSRGMARGQVTDPEPTSPGAAAPLTPVETVARTRQRLGMPKWARGK
ncbi:type IV secretory system conjugative DNA transfer family protein [Nocardioides sp. PD653]|uniref:type IV secretory system conjugative DNA transfer family protein n=1 Tax=Nocardioides sp. PD653 TaxID=393303 RepID=UPI001F61A7F9|nr:TraM recognition domain-containing protein [Nocardioides sp. PD653]